MKVIFIKHVRKRFHFRYVDNPMPHCELINRDSSTPSMNNILSSIQCTSAPERGMVKVWRHVSCCDVIFPGASSNDTNLLENCGNLFHSETTSSDDSSLMRVTQMNQKMIWL